MPAQHTGAELEARKLQGNPCYEERPVTKQTLLVPNISCEHCEHAIIGALSQREGVESVLVDIPARQVLVSFDERRISLEEMKQILAAEEYPVASTG